MLNKKVIIVLVVLILLIHFHQIKRIKSLNYWKKKNKKILQKCRRNLKEIYDLIETKNKFLISGTLLGSVRDNDIIPFDDDVDIGIYVTNENDIQNIKKQIQKSCAKYNFEYKETFFGSKCIKDKVSVDIFFYKPDGKGRFVYVSKIAQSFWPNEYYYTDELTHFEKSIISGNSYNVCRNPSKHLKRAYGKNWKTPYITHIHSLFSSFTITNLMNSYLIIILKIFNLHRVK